MTKFFTLSCAILFLFSCSTDEPRYDNNLTVSGGEDIAASHNSAFYLGPFELTLRPKYDSLDIRYTLDGSYPDETSLLYTGPISIVEHPSKKDKISDIPTTPMEGKWQLEHFKWKQPTNVPLATTIRYRCYNVYGDPVGKPYTQTYFVGNDHIHDFGVVSLITEKESLFDEEDGIFVPGIRYSPEKWTDDWWPPGNYRMQGRAWERRAHISYFDSTKKEVFSTNGGLRLNGQAIAAFPQKSLRFIFRKDYGDSDIPFPYFSDHKVDRYKKILLRNSGNDAFSTLFRDALLQEHIREMDVETQRYSPAILYINGEYWGVYNFRDRFDENYFKDNHGLRKNEYDLVEGYEGSTAAGNNQSYQRLWKVVRDEDLTLPENYARVDSMMDIQNFIDYNLIQTYFGNNDWPANNVKAWRAKKEGSKFRWMIFDLDFCLGYNILGSENSPEFDMIAHSTEQNSKKWSNAGHSTVMFRKLLDNETFRKQFVCRYLELEKSIFSPETILAQISKFEGRYKGAIPQHIERWGYPTDMKAWSEQVNIMREFAQQRPALYRQHLESYLGSSLEVVCSQ